MKIEVYVRGSKKAPIFVVTVDTTLEELHAEYERLTKLRISLPAFMKKIPHLPMVVISTISPDGTRLHNRWLPALLPQKRRGLKP